MIQNSFYLEVNQETILNNLNVLKEWKKKGIIPVIKANAYGHGIVKTAKICLLAGITQVAVARYEEARFVLQAEEFVEERKKTQEFQILVFESIDDVQAIKEEQRIDISINSLEELKTMIAQGISTKRMHLKLDLGFARNGIEIADRKALRDYILAENLSFKGIFSHLFSVSYQDGLEAIHDFRRALDGLGRERFERIHLQNTVSSYHYDCDFVTDIRLGMLVYGLQEPGYYHEEIKQAFCLKGNVDGVRSVEELDYVAYEYKSNLSLGKGSRIAKIKIGYADGFGKENENTPCLIRRKEYRIVQVSMDNTFIEVDGRVTSGDEVILFHNPSILKTTTGRYVYESLSVLSGRLPRRWVEKTC